MEQTISVVAEAARENDDELMYPLFSWLDQDGTPLPPHAVQEVYKIQVS